MDLTGEEARRRIDEVEQAYLTNAAPVELDQHG